MKNIAIIGGGVGGLVLAYRLLRRGDAVTILEKSDEVGGLLGGFKIGETHLEKTYHHIFKTDTDVINLIKELGLENKLIWNESSIGLFYDGVMYPFVTPMDLLKFKPLGLFDKLRLGLAAIYLQKDNNWQKYAGVTAEEWMKKWCGDKAYRVIWEPLLKGKFHDYSDKVSMAWLWARIHTRGNSKDSDGKERLGYMNGGFQVLIDKLVDEIKKLGGEIKLNQEISDVESLATKYTSVVATIPNPSPTLPLTGQGVSQIHYLGAVCVVFTSKKSLSKYYWHNINDLKSPFLAFIQHTNLVDKKNYGGKHVYYLGTYVPHDHRFFKISEDEMYREFFDYLKKIVGKFAVEKKYLFRLKNAQHIVTTNYQPPAYETSVKNLYLMNFSQIYPEDRGINYAVREANKMAIYL